jgi:hypothetical protein
MKISDKIKSPEIFQLLNSYSYQRSLHDTSNLINNKTKKRKIIYIHGNCQTLAIERILAEIFEIRKNFIVISNAVHNVDLNHLEYVLSSIVRADYFICQPVKLGYRKTNKLSTEYLKSLLKDSCKVISFPNIFFEGYFPEQLVFDINVLNSPCHDYNLLRFYLKGNSVETINHAIKLGDFYKKEDVLYNFNSSLEELQRRELENALDIKVSEIILKEYRENKLFHTINHPTRKMLLYVLEYILQKLDIEVNLPEQGCDPINQFEFPLQPNVYSILKCNFDNPQVYKIRNSTYDRVKYIKTSIDEYNLHNVDWKAILSTEKSQRILEGKGLAPITT